VIVPEQLPSDESNWFQILKDDNVHTALKFSEQMDATNFFSPSGNKGRGLMICF
jgi:hypothetical protein